MIACFQIAECSLSYAKIQELSEKENFSRRNLQKLYFAFYPSPFTFSPVSLVFISISRGEWWVLTLHPPFTSLPPEPSDVFKFNSFRFVFGLLQNSARLLQNPASCNSSFCLARAIYCPSRGSFLP